jgi:hypothetical protein
MDSDPSRDKADHSLAGLTATTYPIYQLPPKSDYEGIREFYMVGEGEELPQNTDEEIAHEVEEEITRAAQLAMEADKGKRNNHL